MSDTLVGFEEAPRTKYTQIPNIVDDMDIDPYTFRLYAHLRRVAGETGACWQSTNTLARSCNMSTGKVSQCKQLLRDAGLIRIEKRDGGHGPYDNITIIDIWRQNAKHSSGERLGSLCERMSSSGEGMGSPGETKNNPLRKTQEEKPTEEPAPEVLSVQEDQEQTPKDSTLYTIKESTLPLAYELKLPRYGGNFNCPHCDTSIEWPISENKRNKVDRCPSCDVRFIIYSQKSKSGVDRTYQAPYTCTSGTHDVTFHTQPERTVVFNSDQLEMLAEYHAVLLPALAWAERKNLFGEWTEGSAATGLLSACDTFTRKREKVTEDPATTTELTPEEWALWVPEPVVDF